MDRKLKQVGLILFLLMGNAFATTYYVAAAGADTNNGTGKATPWAHAPGMSGCSNTCASTTLVAGDQVTFKGGDSWTLSATWLFPSSGGAGNRIVVGGLDQTWFTGGSWVRPVLTGNGTFPGGPVIATPFLQLGTQSHLEVEQLEFTGLNWHVTICTTGVSYISKSSGTDVLLHDNYFHGWTHTAVCEGNNANAVSALVTDSTSKFYNNVIDGSDTTQDSFGGISGGGFGEVYQNYFAYLDNGLNVSGLPLIHDNVFNHTGFPVYAGGTSKSNVALSSLDATGGMVFYNNIVMNTWFTGSGTSSAVPVMLVPKVGDTSYAFNNVFPNGGDYGGSALWCGEFTSAGSSGGTCNFFNNTIEAGADAGPPSTTPFRVGASLPGTHPAGVTETNNHVISSSVSLNTFGSGCIAPACPLNVLDNLSQTKATANAQGYTLGQTFSFSPTLSSNSTVGIGVNLSPTCTAIGLVNAAAGTACMNDTTYGVTYNSTNHTVSFPARVTNPRPTAVFSVTNKDDTLSNWFVCYIGNCPGGGSPGGSGVPTAVNQTINNASPSQDGKSMLITQTGQTGQFTDVLWYFESGAQNTATYLQGDYWVYPSTLSSPNPFNTLEYDTYQYLHSSLDLFMFGSHCIVGGKWQVWNSLLGAWVDTSLTCSLTFSAWHHITWQVHRVPGDTSCSGHPCMFYDALTIDGVRNGPPLCAGVPCVFPAGALNPSFVDQTGLNFQLDAKPVGGTINENLDLVSLVGATAPWDVGAYQFTAPTSPVASFSPTSLVFPNTVVGSTSIFETVHVTNTGGAPLIFSSINFQTGTQFTFTFSSCAQYSVNGLPVGQSCDVDLAFAPTSVGLKTDNIVFTDNATGSPQSFPITGTGISPPLTGSACNFSGGIILGPGMTCK